MVWTLIEPGVAIIASSLATIRPLLRAMGIKGFQTTGYGTRPRGTNGTHPKTNQSNEFQGGFLGSAAAELPDIELAHTKSRVVRAPSTAERRMSRSQPSGLSTRVSRRASRGPYYETPTPPQNTKPGGDDGKSAKSFRTGIRRFEIRHSDNEASSSSTTTTTVATNNNPAMSQTPQPYETWLDSDQLSSRESSADSETLQPEHNQDDIRIGLVGLYKR